MTTPHDTHTLRERLVKETVRKIEYEIQINHGWKEDNTGFAGFTKEGKELIASVLTTYGDAREAAAREEEKEDDLIAFIEAIDAVGLENIRSWAVTQLRALQHEDYPASNCIECGEPVNESEAIKNCHGNCRIQL